MSEKLIPEHIDPYRFAEQSISLSGVVNIADMGRLRSSLSAQDNTVKADIQFGVDEQGITFLKGHIETVLSLQCQRCLETFNYEIMSDFMLGVVKSLEEANSLPKHYEPALSKEGSLALRDLIEDELILNLPIIPRHEPEECKVKLPVTDSEWEKEKNPFHILESLKHKQR